MPKPIIKPRQKDRAQSKRLIEAAREAGASEDEAVFEEKLGKIAKVSTKKPRP